LRQCGFIVTKNTPLKVRLVRVELKESVEVLITNLWQEEGYRNEELKEVYFLRWGGGNQHLGAEKHFTA
jgi:hypothetical protein